jgi:hypothetical protein
LRYGITVDADTMAGRVEVDRRSLADLIDLTFRAAESLKYADMALADALRGAALQVQVETFLAG